MVKILVHILNAMVVNSYIMYKAATKPNGRYSLVDFILPLCNSLRSRHMISREQNGVSLEQPLCRFRSDWEKDTSRLFGQHFPRKDFSGNTKKGRNYKQCACMLCGVKGITKCKQCCIYLCIEAKPDRPTCWENFHTCKSFENLESSGIPPRDKR